MRGCLLRLSWAQQHKQLPLWPAPDYALSMKYAFGMFSHQSFLVAVDWCLCTPVKLFLFKVFSRHYLIWLPQWLCWPGRMVGPSFIEEECGTQRKILCSNNALQSASGGAGLAFEFDSFSSFLPFSHSSLVSYLNFILILVSRAEHTKDSFTLLFSNEKIKLQ